MNKTHTISSISIIGFDVRIRPSSAAELVLTDDMRKRSLICSDYPFILSADRYVWPSVFHFEGSAPLLPAMEGVSLPVSATNRYFGAFDLWDNAAQMALATQDLSEPSCGIAFGLTRPDRYETEVVTDSWFDAIYEGIGISPPNPGSDWPFLGFDVVNSGFTSALSGFGPLKDIENVRKELKTSTNRFCLFSDQKLSTRFCHVANKRYVSDGPFFSIALFLLWDDTDELSPKNEHLKKADT